MRIFLRITLDSDDVIIKLQKHSQKLFDRKSKNVKPKNYFTGDLTYTQSIIS